MIIITTTHLPNIKNISLFLSLCRKEIVSISLTLLRGPGDL